MPDTSEEKPKQVLTEERDVEGLQEGRKDLSWGEEGFAGSGQGGQVSDLDCDDRRCWQED